MSDNTRPFLSTSQFVRIEIHYPPTGEIVGIDYKLAVGEKFEDTWKELYDKYLGKPLSERAKVLSDTMDALQTLRSCALASRYAVEQSPDDE